MFAPSGSLHAAAFLEPMRYVAFTLRNLGYSVVMRVNQMDPSSINVIFGAHTCAERLPDDCGPIIIFNLEQLIDRQPHEPKISALYRKLLYSNVVIDYDMRNVMYYRSSPSDLIADVKIFEFANAPYLRRSSVSLVENRTIDLLFFGSLNRARATLIKRIEGEGVGVHCVTPLNPVYGEEMNELIRNSTGVLNVPFYESRVFEQVRAFQVLSCGTPLLSVGLPSAPSHFVEAVHWISYADVEIFFRSYFRSHQWYRESEAQLQRWSCSGGRSSCDWWADLFSLAIKKRIAFRNVE